MKKLLALALMLCVLCLSCVSAFADTSDGSPLKLDGLTLAMNAGARYDLGSKAVGAVYVTVYPNAAAGDIATNFNLAWNGGPFAVSTTVLDASREILKSQMVAGLEGAGYTVNSFEYGNAFDYSIGGVNSVAIDFNISMTAMGMNIDVYQRQFYVGDKGFVFTVSTATSDVRDSLSAQVALGVNWN